MNRVQKRKLEMEAVYNDDINAYIGLKYSHMGYWRDDNPDSFHRAQEAKLIKLMEPLEIKPSDRILDIGGGQGETAIWITKRYNCRVLIADIVDNMIQKAREAIKEAGLTDHIQAVCEDILTLKENEASFNHIVSVGALHHIADKEKLFKKIASLLKPGGKLAASIYLSDMKPGLLKELYLKLTLGDKDISPISHYLSAIENSGLGGCEVEDISDAVLPKSSQMLEQEPYYSKIDEYHRKYYGRFSTWLLPWFFKWNRYILRKKQLGLVICRAQKN